MDAMRDLGPCMSPFNAWLFIQGLETLALRAERHIYNTITFAKWLEAHPCVAWVNYPGLESHKDYALTKRLLPKGAGGVLTFGVAGDIKEVEAVVDNLKLCSHLANVGDAKTLIIHPWRTTHQQIPDQEKIKGGVTPDLIRVSLGLEHIDDIVYDFEQAFEAAGLSKEGKSWQPTWMKDMTEGTKWSEGTLYAPNPNGRTKKKVPEKETNGHAEATEPGKEAPKANGTTDDGKAEEATRDMATSV